MIHKKAFNKTTISWLFVAALSLSASTAFSQQAGKEKEAETTASISPSKLTIETDETDLNGDGKPDIVFKKYLRAGSSIMERIDQADGIIIYQIMRNNQMVLFLNYTPKSNGYTVSFTPGLTCRIDIKSGKGNVMERIILMEGNKFLEEFTVDEKGNVTPISEGVFELQITGRRSIEDGRTLRRRGTATDR